MAGQGVQRAHEFRPLEDPSLLSGFWKFGSRRRLQPFFGVVEDK